MKLQVWRNEGTFSHKYFAVKDLQLLSVL